MPEQKTKENEDNYNLKFDRVCVYVCLRACVRVCVLAHASGTLPEYKNVTKLRSVCIKGVRLFAIWISCEYRDDP